MTTNDSSTTDLAALLSHAQQWAENDITAADHDAISALVSRAKDHDHAAIDELTAAFSGPVRFGTAGLRAAIGPGESRMNCAVVARATAGLVTHLEQQYAESDSPLQIVVGHDARHGSADFAREAAAVITARGHRALVLPPHSPTPVVAYAVAQLRAQAGIMITASHNPPADNGYKVYEGLTKAGVGLHQSPTDDQDTDERYVGVQIVSPTDSQIAACIDAEPPARELPRSATDDASDDAADASELLCHVGEEIIDSYLDTMVSALAVAHGETEPAADTSAAPADSELPQPRIVLTPMHGVGGFVATRALRAAGLTTVIPVESQFAPDPDFPTVDFPNPEEAGALDEAIRVATQQQADLIIALDPDADRCSIAIPTADGDGWRQLTGDQVGIILADYWAAQWTQRSPRPAVLANSIVSSQQLQTIAHHYGLSYQPTLTGFKYLGRIPQLLFAYEEALGYCPFPDSVGDKDGIATAMLLATILQRVQADGEDFSQVLERIARRDGTYLTTQVSFRVNELSDRDQALAQLLREPPEEIAGSAVTDVHNLTEGYQGLAPTDGVIFFTADKTRVIVRPSGTEPKLKCYIEVVDQSQQRLADVASAMREIIGL